jgi:hypothetical protein
MRRKVHGPTAGTLLPSGRLGPGMDSTEMQRDRFKPALFAGLILAALAAGCAAGSGGHGTLPGTPATAVDARHRQRVGATLRIHIPADVHRRRKHRGASYVSPNMQSLTVGVTLVTASPWPSMPPQTLAVNTPAPCIIAGGSGGYTCTFAVKAYVGKNIFTFNEYASKSPSPQDTPLGTLTTGETTVASGASLNFVLEGVVNRVLLAVPDPESSTNPNSEPIPIGAPTTFPLAVNPEDASGASIATDTFSSPITIQVSSLAAGVSLALNKQCAGDTTSAAKVTLNCAADLNQVSVAYDGTAASSGTAYVDTASIVASPQASPSPQPAIVALASNIVATELLPPPTGFTTPYVDFSNISIDPSTGKLVFAVTYNSTNPTMVEFDPANPSAATSAALGFTVTGLTVDTTGNIWTNDGSNSQLHCFAGIAASPVSVNISDSAGTITPPQIIEDGSGNIWYTGQDESEYPAAGFFPASCSNATQVAQFQYGNYLENPYSLALAAPSGGNPGVVITAGGPPAVPNLYTLYTNSAPSPPPTLSWPMNDYPAGIVNDPSYNLYAGTGTSTDGIINQIASGSNTLGVLETLQPDTDPYGIAQFSGTHSTPQSLLVEDDEYTGAILTSPATTTAEPLELVPPNGWTCGPVAYDKKGGAWEVCAQVDGSLWAYRLAVTSTWSALPNAFVASFSAYNSVLTVAETSGNDSSPFTVTSNTNPSVLATGTPWPATPAFPHAIPIAVETPGSTTLTIVDKHGRTQQLAITVSPSGVQPSIRRHHRHPKGFTHI